MSDALVIMPCFNEERNIRNVIASLLELEYDIDILLVNDGSTDNTLNQVQGLSIVVVSHPFNLGYGAALQTGFKYATENGYKYIIQLDSDGQHDVKYVQAILNKLRTGSIDLVIGSRFLSGAEQMHFGYTKRVAIGFFKYIIKLFGNKKLTDPTSGYKGMSRKLFSYYSRRGRFPSDFPDADVLIQTLRSGFKLDEISVGMRDRTEGVSMHSGLKPIYYMIKVTLSILIVMLREKIIIEE
ncbi:MAG: glycosyltransferase family 2 protein [Herbinix sp.]|nr:glycosyltransferase family 2 protein [Herbinix sp.]